MKSSGWEERDVNHPVKVVNATTVVGRKCSEGCEGITSYVGLVAQFPRILISCIRKLLRECAIYGKKTILPPWKYVK